MLTPIPFAIVNMQTGKVFIQKPYVGGYIVVKQVRVPRIETHF